MSVSAGKTDGFNFLGNGLFFGVGPCGGRRISTFFTSLHRATPKIAKCVVTSSERVITIPLSVGQRAIVAESLQQCLDTPFRIVGRPLCCAVKEDVEFNP